MAIEVLRKVAISPQEEGENGLARGAAFRTPVPNVEEVYARHFAYVYRCLRHLGVRDTFLDDATQDVFVVVNRKLHGFDGGVALTTWLYAIVLRVARRYRERQAVARRFDDLTEDASHTEERPDARLDTLRELDLARLALECLDEGKREVYVLHEVEGMTASEVATVTGLPVNTVYSRLRAARAEFDTAAKRLALRRRSP
jgi:RNA polymerase sigma-70 factor (ECF subfamily)